MAELKETRQSIRLTAEDQKIIAALRKKLGQKFSGVVRLGIRKLAQAEGIRQ